MKASEGVYKLQRLIGTHGDFNLEDENGIDIVDITREGNAFIMGTEYDDDDEYEDEDEDEDY